MFALYIYNQNQLVQSNIFLYEDPLSPKSSKIFKFVLPKINPAQYGLKTMKWHF